MKQTDILIIGSGISALQLVRNLREDFNVTILTKEKLASSNSYLAQGGIASALGPNDHPHKHARDTLAAGRYHNDVMAVYQMTEAAPGLIKELVGDGCEFDGDENGNLLLGLEGAHSENRIVHAGGDATGRWMIDYLKNRLNGNVTIYENMYAYELLVTNGQCIGVKAKDSAGTISSFIAAHIVVATGGCGQLYSYTSNAKTVTGDGLALAYQAGVDMADMEFIQFHPTILYKEGKTCGLISEAVRGEGARLVNQDGDFLMESVHPLGDLAPRHIVSQAIYEQIQKGNQVYLDISYVKNFPKRFPTIEQICRQNGIDLTNHKIPIVPGSHFLMGGIKTNLNGETSIARLYAIGEVACTGIHGANRLASNSLLEGLFVGKNLANLLNKQKPSKLSVKIEAPNPKKRLSHLELPSIEAIQAKMMENVGIVRNQSGLVHQMQWLQQYQLDRLLTANLDDCPTNEITIIFMLITASLVTRSALKRTESRGGHFRRDYPCENDHLWKQKQIILSNKTEEKQNESIEIKTAT